MGKALAIQDEDTVTAILRHVADPEYRPLKLRQLAKELAVDDESYTDFRRLIKDLVRRGDLVRMRQNKYAPPMALERIEGVLRIHPKGFGFVVRNGADADLMVRGTNLGGAVDGDRVQAQVLSQKGWQGVPEGRIVSVEERQAHRVLATYIERGKWRFARPDDGRWGREITLEGSVPDGVADGYKVWIEVGGRRNQYGQWQGHIDEVLGDPSAPGLDHIRVCREFNLPLAFPAAAETEAEAVGAGLAQIDAGRADFRHWTCFTIDPEEAQDFDDALSVRSLPDGGFELGVHIADVCHYVAAGGALDAEAKRRGTSVYMIDRVVPMLPPKLSSDVCTLAPDKDRKTISVLMRVGQDGQVETTQICHSLIRSKARLTYGQAQAALNPDVEGKGAAQGLEEQLVHLDEVCGILRNRRWLRGALDFEIPEPMVHLDEDGVPVSLGRYPRLASHRLVEECMLVANECVGAFLAKRQIPTLYRVHPAPDETKLKTFSDYVRSIGVAVPRGVPAAQQMQTIVTAVQDRDDRGVIHMLLLRAMMRADYRPEDIGHYGLACEAYLHFTSPIRRYPDLLVHRILKEELAGELTQERREVWQKGLNEAGREASAAERVAQDAERAFIRIKQLRYMVGFLGERLSGHISGFSPSGIFVSLGNTQAEGYCRLAQLDDYFELDPRSHRLVGKRSGKVYQLGEEVEVRITNVNLAKRHLELDLISGQAKGQRRQTSRRKSTPRLKRKIKKRRR
jgi:ribonuclease R